MARPVGFEGANDLILAPKGAEDYCSDLPATINGRGIFFCVRFTEEEIKQISEEGVAWVHILSNRMPMISVSGFPDLENMGLEGPLKAEPFIPTAPNNKKSR